MDAKKSNEFEANAENKGSGASIGGGKKLGETEQNQHERPEARLTRRSCSADGLCCGSFFKQLFIIPTKSELQGEGSLRPGTVPCKMV